MKKLFIYSILCLILLSGCVTRVYQIDGKPLQNNVVSTTVMGVDLKLKYNFVQSFNVKEGKEYYSSYKFLNIMDPKVHVIQNPTALMSHIYIFNSSKAYYKLVTFIQPNGGDANIQSKVLYQGKLSRHNFDIVLPIVGTRDASFYFTILNENDELLFSSFKVRYRIEEPDKI